MRIGRKTAAGVGGAAVSVITAAMAFIQPWEGTRLDPYQDIVGVWTVCTGETNVPMRHYSNAECNGLLRKALASDYAPGVLAAVPAIKDHPGPFVASISLAYNIGVPNFRRSTVARRFNRGDWKGGCDAFRMWNRAGGQYVAGLARRRAAERRVCLGGLN